jgi:hypothetical protein
MENANMIKKDKPKHELILSDDGSSVVLRLNDEGTLFYKNDISLKRWNVAVEHKGLLMTWNESRDEFADSYSKFHYFKAENKWKEWVDGCWKYSYTEL